MCNVITDGSGTLNLNTDLHKTVRKCSTSQSNVPNSKMSVTLGEHGVKCGKLDASETANCYDAIDISMPYDSDCGNVNCDVKNVNENIESTHSMKKKSVNLKIGNLNIRSLINKIDQFTLFLEKYKFDILGLNETWLDESIADAEVSVPGYRIIRNDRNRYGGGVCFYIKDTIQFGVRNDLNSGIESLWIDLKLKQQCLCWLLFIGRRVPVKNILTIY